MLTQIKRKLIPQLKLADEGFDVQKAGTCQLVLYFNTWELKLAVKELSKNRFVAFESYKLEGVYELTDIAGLIKLLLKQNQLLQGNYKHIVGYIVNKQSTLVPVPLYDESQKKQYIGFNAHLNEEDIVLADNIKNIDVKNVFAIASDFQQLLNELFPGIDIHHFSSALIDELIKVNKNQTVRKVYVHFQAGQFEVLVIEGKKLLFYNAFSFQTTEDFIYYLLFVFEQLLMNPETMETTVLGEMDKNSGYFTTMQKYVRNVKLGERNDSADFSHSLQNIPKNTQFVIFSAYADK